MRLRIFHLSGSLALLLAALLLLSACGGSPNSTRAPSSSAGLGGLEPSPAAFSGFVHTEGEALCNAEGEALYIRSVSITSDNLYGLDEAYADIAALGFTAVRFHFFADTLEDPEDPFRRLESGWALIDAHMAAARAHGLGVLFSMHAPPGGLGVNVPLWTEPEYQKRLLALWTDIAARYADETTLLAYGLVSEPKPVAEDDAAAFAAWQTLAQAQLDAIRAVDTRHFLLVENTASRVDAQGGLHGLELNAENRFGFPRLNDPSHNYAYETHIYDDYAFTHQTAQQAAGFEALSYPNDLLVSLSCSDPLCEAGQGQIYENGGEESQWLESALLPCEEDSAYLALGFSLWQEELGGSVALDALRLEEYDENGKLLGSLLELEGSNPAVFTIWRENGETTQTSFAEGEGAIVIHDPANFTIASLDAYRLPVQKGHSYKLWVQLRGYDFCANSQLTPWLGLYHYENGQSFNRDFLAQLLEKFSSVARAERRPLLVGEFGLSHAALNNGGFQWLSDMLELMEAAGIHYNFFAYDDDYFGITGLSLEGRQTELAALLQKRQVR